MDGLAQLQQILRTSGTKACKLLCTDGWGWAAQMSRSLYSIIQMHVCGTGHAVTFLESYWQMYNFLEPYWGMAIGLRIALWYWDRPKIMSRSFTISFQELALSGLFSLHLRHYQNQNVTIKRTNSQKKSWSEIVLFILIWASITIMFNYVHLNYFLKHCIKILYIIKQLFFSSPNSCP